MEQRWAERIDTRVPTRLMTSDGQIVNAVIRNISMGGFFLETDQLFSPYACVDVCVRLPGESGWCTHKVPAVVTNTRLHGVGLMFSAIDRKLCAALSNLSAQSGRSALKFDGVRSMGMPVSPDARC